MTRVRHFFSGLLSSLWFVPMLLILGSVGLAFASIEFDRWQGDALAKRLPRLIGTDAEGAREMLSVIAGSMITVAGVAFSITIVALALTASQYSSRVLRNFMRNSSNQIVLGGLAGIFTYCLVVLRNVTGSTGFMPGLAVAIGSILALVGVLLLIYFLHHVARSIQASNMAAEIAGATIKVIERMFPNGESRDEPANHPNVERWTEISSTHDGYIQRIDRDKLERLAREQDLSLAIRGAIGDFVIKGAPLAALSKAPSDLESCETSINSAFVLGAARTLVQDPMFGIRQLVDIAVKALSPGINDPTTACACINYIAAILCRIARSKLEAADVWEGAALRLTGGTCTFEKFILLAFEEIISNARNQLNVLAHLLTALERVGSAAGHSQERRKILLPHLAAVEHLLDSVEVLTARERLRRKVRELREMLIGPAGQQRGYTAKPPSAVPSAASTRQHRFRP